MLTPNKPKSAKAKRSSIPELTPGQQIAAIVVFLLVALFCFSLGIVVGRYQPPTGPVSTAGLPTPNSLQRDPLPPSPRRQSPSNQTLPDGEGEQSSPKPVRMPNAATSGPGFPGVNTPQTGMDGTQPPPGRVFELPAPSTPRKEPERSMLETAPPDAATGQPPTTPAALEPKILPGESPAAVEPPGQDSSAGPMGADPQPSAITTAAASPVNPTAPTRPRSDEPEIVESTPVGSAATEEPAALEPLAAASPAAPATPAQPAAPLDPGAPSAATGGFTVQVHSFTGPRRAEMARQARDKLVAAGVTADIVSSADGVFFRVIVGNYTNKTDAAKACAELKSRPDIPDDCFVRQR